MQTIPQSNKSTGSESNEDAYTVLYTGARKSTDYLGKMKGAYYT